MADLSVFLMAPSGWVKNLGSGSIGYSKTFLRFNPFLAAKKRNLQYKSLVPLTLTMADAL